jgi:transposase
MILSQEQWMELRAFKALADAGATWAEIARETGYDWRTVKRYLAADAPAVPPAPARRGGGPRLIDPYIPLVDAWLRKQPKLKASVIWERLVAEHGFTGHYQRVKVYVRENRARLTETRSEPAGFHRRFEVLPGAQAQVDWGDEGEIATAAGPLRVSSFHMTLSYSRDPFCCFTASKDLGTFWDCHRRAFAHFGGVPAQIVYDRTKTVIRRHVGRGQATPLHPEAVAFASHYDFAIWLAAPYRAQTKGRVERQVEIVRSHVLDGRSFASLGELDAAFAAWLPIRRAQVHRTHGEVIGVRAQRDRAALGPLPEQPYVVCDRHTRRVGKDAPDLVCGQPLLGALAAGPPRRPGRAARHPDRGRDLVARPQPAAARHPPSRHRTRRLGRRPDPLGRTAQPGRRRAAAAVHRRLRARPGACP